MKIRGLRWWIIGLVCLATIINYIDRSALAIMWPDISQDLGMDKNDYALISKRISGSLRDWTVRIG